MEQAELSDLLDRLLAQWENEVVEFKAAREQFSADKTGAYVSALSNEANLRGVASAWLVFGVSDARQVVGTKHLPGPDAQHSLKHFIYEGTDPSLTIREIHELERDGRRVVLAEVPAAPRGIPISWKGDYRARAGESLVPLPLDKLDAIRGQTVATDWTAVVVPEARIDDLDRVAIARARQGFTDRYASSIPPDTIASWDDATFLEKARLTRGGQIARGTLLLLGAPSSSHLLSPHPAQLTWKLLGQEQAYEHFHPPFLLTAGDLASRIRNVRLRLLPPNELIYREIDKYDERSILEAIYNAIAHQDYGRHARIVVTEHVDRLEFLNAGEFYDGGPDDYRLGNRTPIRYRNPFLVEAMHRLHLIDQLGYGIHRMVEDQVRRFLPLPDYDLSRPGEVTLSLPGAVIEEAYTKLLMVRADLPLEDVLALDRVQKRLPISSAATSRLRKAKLIEGRKPHLHVAETVASSTGRLAEYVRTRPQTDAHYATLISDYLTRAESATRQEIDALLNPLLPEVLTPQQKRSKVSNLLTKLRREGSIHNTGTRSKPRWERV